MDIITYLQTIFYTISSVLIYPVMILLIGLLMMLIFTMGRFLGEYFERRKYQVRHNVKVCLTTLTTANFTI